MGLVFLKTDSMTSWGLTKVKAHQQIFQRKSSLPLRYPHVFGEETKHRVTHWASVPNIPKHWDLHLSHTFTFCAPGDSLLSALKWTNLARASTFTSWGEMPLEDKSNYKVQLQKYLPHIQGGERNTQQKGPINLLKVAWVGRGTRIIWRQNFWEGDITKCK